jgi:DNA modification methylase
MDDLAIAWRPLGALIPYARNPRTHSDAQVAQIAASIREFGWTNPVLVDGASGIIAGHGRVLAARKLGLDRVPVIELAHMSEAQKRAYVLADNQLALNAGWDEALLRVELADLSEMGFDLGLIGFGDGELERLLAGEGKIGLTDDDDAPPLPEQAVTQPGDVWILGEHRLLCGDATVMADVERVLDGSLADMTWTDPPYNVDYGSSAKDKLRGNKRKILNDDLGSGFEAFLHDACANILSVTRGAVYVCMSSSELHTLQRAFTASGGKWSTFVIWAKHTFTLGRADYQRQYEPILYGWPAGHDRYWCGARDQGDVWFVDKPARNDLHPTMKPVALVERAIRNSSKSRDIVLDPFGGSGSILIACAKSGRHARLVELDPRYCDVIVRRWQEWTGRQARLDSDGHTFEEVAAGRGRGGVVSAIRADQSGRVPSSRNRAVLPSGTRPSSS